MEKDKKKKHANRPYRITRHGSILCVIVVAIIATLTSLCVWYLSNRTKKEADIPSISLPLTLNEEKTKSEEISNVEQRSKSNAGENKGRWIYYGSHVADKLDSRQKQSMDKLVNQWTKGQFTDDELTDVITGEVCKQGMTIQTAGVLSCQVCLFENDSEIPDYEKRLKESTGIYDFIGLYTEDRVSEDGKLICYYWEAGVR